MTGKSKVEMTCCAEKLIAGQGRNKYKLEVVEVEKECLEVKRQGAVGGLALMEE